MLKVVVVFTILDPVYTRTDPNWYGSEMDPFQFFSSVYTGSDPNHCPFTLGTGLEQFHSLCPLTCLVWELQNPINLHFKLLRRPLFGLKIYDASFHWRILCWTQKKATHWSQELKVAVIFISKANICILFRLCGSMTWIVTKLSSKNG